MRFARRGFTLIELLIVIGILAVLATVAVLVINPSELFKQARDTQRLADLSAIDRGLQYAGLFALQTGTPQRVYISIPDSDPGCANITGLPALTSPWVYVCATSANYRKVDGTGWIPVNFASTNAGIFTQLPIDPQNITAGNYFYTYITGSYALSAQLESVKYQTSSAAADGGSVATRMEIGPEIVLLSQTGGNFSASVAANTAPTANNVSVSTSQNTPVTINLSGTDPEQCEITFSLQSSPANGSLGAISNQTCITGSSPKSDSATVVYTPTNGFSGSNSFTYQVNDGTNNSNVATVSITVTGGGNTLPTADNKIPTVSSGALSTVSLSGSDPEQCQLTFTVVANPAHGSLGSITNQNCTAGTPNIDTATIPYTSTGGYFGADSFTYKTNDGLGDSPSNATVSLTVNLPAHTVTAVAPTTGVNNNSALTLTSITGTGFVSPVTVKLKKSGQTDITATTCTVASATSVTGCTFNLTGALAGVWDVAVTNADSQIATLSAGFTVTAAPTAPTVTAISPATGMNNTSVFVTSITGTNFVSPVTVQFTKSGQTSITATSCTVGSTTSITGCSVDITGAVTGSWGITVTNTGSGLSGTFSNGFTVSDPTPTVTALGATTGVNNASVAVSPITGTNFVSPVTVQLVKSGQTSITATGCTVASGTSVTGCSFNINGAATGAWDVTVTNTGSGLSGTLSASFTVTAPSGPTVSSASPSSRGQGAFNQNITVTGTGFVSGATIAFSNAGITVNSLTFVSATQLTANIAVSASASTGAGNITVTNPNTTQGTCTSCFTINTGPTPTAASPTTRGQGANNQIITVTGTNFVSGATVTFGGGATGIVVNSTNVISATQLTTDVTFGASVTATAKNINVNNPDGGSKPCTGCLTVNASPNPTATSPSSRGQGGTNQNITLTGTSFVSGATVAFSGTGITVNSVTFVSATSLTVNIAIASGATTGSRNVTVTNPDAGVKSCSSCFTVSAGPNPTSASPSSLMQGATSQTVTITGTGFAGGASTVISGTGVTVNSTTFGGATSLSLNVTVAAGATVSSRDITVTNSDGGVLTCTGCFSVTSSVSLPSGLIAEWLFSAGSGSTAADTGGSNNTGTLTSGPTWSASGHTGNALSFDGLNDYVSVPDSNSLESASGITISAWVNLTGVGSWTGQDNGGDYIVTKGRSGSNPYMSYALGWVPSSGKFSFITAAGGTYTSITTNNSFSGGAGWRSVVGTYDGTNMKIYVNGVLEGTLAASGNIAYSIGVDDLYIGSWNFSTYLRQFYGIIDDVRIFNRGLSAAEVAGLP